MRLPFLKTVLIAAFFGGALLLSGARSQALLPPGDSKAQSASDPAAQTPPPPTATLQVSGTATAFTISADHADVQSALKLIFDQAGKQFVLSNDVLGQVTMRLERQPLPTVLDAVCDQMFLRYQVSPAGIYQFSRNTAALRAFILRQDTITEAVRQRLQNTGMNVLNLLPAGLAAPPGANNVPRLMGGGGGFGGRSMDAPNTLRIGDVRIQNQAAPKSRAEVAPAERGASAMQYQMASAAQSNLAPETQIVVQPGLISVHTAPDHPVALTDLLQQLSRQTHIPILIDPQVPSGIKFRFAGNLAAHSLTEWLERLAPVARLQWYMLGNQVFITTSPEFAIFYGSSDTPRATFGMTPSSAQRGSQTQMKGANQKNDK